MTENTENLTSFWSTIHEEICLKKGFYPSTRLMWQWILRTGKDNLEVEPDLQEFNVWVKNYRKNPYHRNTLKTAFKQLVESEVITVLRKFSWKIYRVTVKVFTSIKPKKNSQNKQEIHKKTTSNSSFIEHKVIQQQQSINRLENQKVLAAYGINLGLECCDILNSPRTDIYKAVVLFQIRNTQKKILNPSGWVRDCIRKQYWNTDCNYNQIALYCQDKRELWDLMFPYDQLPKAIDSFSIETILDYFTQTKL